MSRHKIMVTYESPLLKQSSLKNVYRSQTFVVDAKDEEEALVKLDTLMSDVVSDNKVDTIFF